MDRGNGLRWQVTRAGSILDDGAGSDRGARWQAELKIRVLAS